jgi:hypothetical protein
MLKKKTKKRKIRKGKERKKEKGKETGSKP